MNSINVANLSRAQNTVDFQITLGTRRRADADRFIGELDVERIDIRFGVDREGANAQFLTGTDDSQRDFAAIGNQDFFEHS
jgi:hypothetical protein